MLAIVVSACLSTAPENCSLQDLGMIKAEGFKACRLTIEPIVQSWALAHPDMTVHGAYCMPMRDEPLK